MDKVEYDMDTSGGLMEEIQTLIAPPQSDDSKHRTTKEAGLYRRPVKTLNRDTCDACKEGGDLLCCDQCPSAFHLQCCDPPLEDEDVPTGEWICNECKYGITKTSDLKLQPPSCSQSEKSDRSSSSRSSSPVDSELGMNPFEKLTAFYRNRNPREFQLPGNLQDFTVMPGDRKRRTPAQSKKKEEEAQRLCFVCSKSSRLDYLIYCDFCPLVFHRDCLMPPLAQDPIGLWLCPNHPENFTPNIKTPKYHQRAEILEELRSNISHNAIKLQFFRRAKKERILMNRRNHQPKRRRTCVVPAIVKAQYRNPPAVVVPDLTPGLNKHLLPHMKPFALPTSEEKEQWLKSVIDLQCSITASLEKTTRIPVSKNPLQASPASTNQASVTSSTGNPIVNKSTSSKLVSTSTTTTTTAAAPSVDTKIKNECSGSSVEKVEDVEMKSADVSDETPQKLNESNSSPVGNVVTTVGDTKPSLSSKLTDSTSTTGAPSKIVIMASPSTTSTSSSVATTSPSTLPSVSPASSNKDNVENSAGKSNSLPQKLTSVTPSGSHMVSSISSEILKDPTLSQLDERLVRILAFQRLQQLVEKKSQQTPKISRPGITEKKIHLQATQTKNAIAVLTPLNGLGPTSYMRYRTFNTGQGADMDLCLSSYGFCNYVSGKHATIFYDQESRQFELLNYSEHGTIVDNVLYSCDFSEKPKITATSSNAKFEGCSSFLDPQHRKRKPPLGRTTRGLGTEFITRGCNCRASASSLIGGSGAGWEGTAVLHHGSYVKFGCLHFVFSIVDCATNALSSSSCCSNQSGERSSNPVNKIKVMSTTTTTVKKDVATASS